MSRHTPGPWHDDGYRIYAPTSDPDPRSGRVIVEYKHVPDFNPSDGPLMAASPDLLAALHTAIDTIRALHGPAAWPECLERGRPPS